MAKDPHAKDPEIIVSAGRMFGVFLVLVVVCALFFGFGYSIGKGAAVSANNGAGGAPAVVVLGQRAAGKPDPAGSASVPTSESASDPSTDASSESKTASTSSSDHPELHGTSAGLYFLQVAAVTKQEDADALVAALRKKDYAVFATNTTRSDKFFHVQIGPFTNQKDVEGLRAKLVAAGYNPIVKKG